MGASAAKNFFGILFVAIAIAFTATLAVTISYSGIFCDPPFAPLVLLKWFVFFGVSVGLWTVLGVVVVLLVVWRLQHTFLQTMWTRRVLVFVLCFAIVAAAAPPFFITPATRAVCAT